MHLGIDLGGTKIETIVLDEQNVERYRHRTPSPQGNYEATIDALYEQVIRAEDDINVSCTIGIGIPGSVSPATGLVQNANSTWLIGHRLAEDLGKRLQRSVAIANDADCFTLSESTDGRSQHHL